MDNIFCPVVFSPRFDLWILIEYANYLDLFLGQDFFCIISLCW
jgi:hypothetical protein